MRYDYLPEALFSEIDDWGYKYIDLKNLKRFLLKSGVRTNEELLIAILRRFDLDGDAKLNIKEFVKGISP